MSMAFLLKKITAVGMILSTALLLGAGCSAKIAASRTAIVSSTDFGVTWQSRSAVVAGKNRTVELSNVDVTRIVFDTTNPDTIFFGTREQGLFGSNTAGATWTQILPGQYVTDVGLVPRERCTVYVLTPVRALRTTNCGSSWAVLLNESRGNVGLTVLTVNQTHPQIVYVASSAGDLFKSQDGGETWSVLSRFPNQHIRRVIIDPHDESLLYLATSSGTILKSTTGGTTWQDISQSLRAAATRLSVSLAYRNFSLLSGSGRMFYASEDAIFRSLSGGAAWERVPILTPNGSSKIYAARPDSRSVRIFTYATKTTFYRTVDAGGHWIARPIASTNDPAIIALHPIRDGTIYMGTKAPVDESAYWASQTPEY